MFYFTNPYLKFYVYNSHSTKKKRKKSSIKALLTQPTPFPPSFFIIRNNNKKSFSKGLILTVERVGSLAFSFAYTRIHSYT